MEINHELLEQILDVQKIIDCVRYEFDQVDKGRNGIYNAKNPKRGCLVWGFMYCFFMVVSYSVMGFYFTLSNPSVVYIWSPLILMIVWTQGIKFLKIKYYTKKMEDNQKAIEDLFDDYEDYLSIIPSYYQHPEAVDTIVKIISHGRAFSMKEALNLTEEELHRERVNRAHQEQLEKMDEQNEKLDEILWLERWGK